MKKTIRTCFLALACLLWMIGIFMLSSQNADRSTQTSDRFTWLFLDVVEPKDHPTPAVETPSGGKTPETTGTDGHASEDITADGAEDAGTKEENTASVQTFSVIKDHGDELPVPKKELFGIAPSQFRDRIRSVAHFLAFGMLGVLVMLTLWSASGRIGALQWAQGFLPCALYGALDEFHQYFVPGRATEFTDWLHDIVGAAIGMAVVALVYFMRKKRIRSRKKAVSVSEK